MHRRMAGRVALAMKALSTSCPNHNQEAMAVDNQSQQTMAARYGVELRTPRGTVFATSSECHFGLWMQTEHHTNECSLAE